MSYFRNADINDKYIPKPLQICGIYSTSRECNFCSSQTLIETLTPLCEISLFFLAVLKSFLPFHEVLKFNTHYLRWDAFFKFTVNFTIPNFNSRKVSNIHFAGATVPTFPQLSSSLIHKHTWKPSTCLPGYTNLFLFIVISIWFSWSNKVSEIS